MYAIRSYYEAEMKRLRDTAEIAYMGNFKAPEADIAAASDGAAPLATGMTESPASDAMDTEAMAKGLQGLK